MKEEHGWEAVCCRLTGALVRRRMQPFLMSRRFYNTDIHTEETLKMESQKTHSQGKDRMYSTYCIQYKDREDTCMKSVHNHINSPANNKYIDTLLS